MEYIVSRFFEKGKIISTAQAKRICETVDNYSSYVQQLSWNVFVNTEKEVDDQSITRGMDDLMAQCSSLFIQQTNGLSSYQMNFLRAICDGTHSDFGSKAVLEEYNLGSKSNISRLKKSLQEKELIEIKKEGIFISDPILEIFLKGR